MNYQTIATDWHAWQQYADPHATMTHDEWTALSTDARRAMLIEAFGPEAGRTYTLTSCKTRDVITGTFDDAIERAISIDAEYQSFGGVTVMLDDEVLAMVDDGEVTL